MKCFKALFAVHGIPTVLMTDNSPQFDSIEMKKFTHRTSSPRYPQFNGFIERMVRIVKRLMKYEDDPYLALLNYRATPLPWCGSQLLMGRRIKTLVPQVKQSFMPKWPYLKDFRESSINKNRIDTTTDGTEFVNWLHHIQRIHLFGLIIQVHKYRVELFNQLIHHGHT